MKTFTVSEQARKGIELKFTHEHEENNLLGIPAGQGLLKEMWERGLNKQPEMKATFQWLDVVPDGNMLRLIKEQNIRDKRALVLVETPPGIGGNVKLHANTICETYNEEEGRVHRIANLFPPPGVELLAEKPATDGFGPEFLVSMVPGSSFRVVRTGKLWDNVTRRNAPPELIVLWEGRWDRRAEYDKWRNPDPELVRQYLLGMLRRSDFSKDDWDSIERKAINPMLSWGLNVYSRNTRHGTA